MGSHYYQLPAQHAALPVRLTWPGSSQPSTYLAPPCFSSASDLTLSSANVVPFPDKAVFPTISTYMRLSESEPLLEPLLEPRLASLPSTRFSVDAELQETSARSQDAATGSDKSITHSTARAAFPTRARLILVNWLKAHTQSPYPTDEEKVCLRWGS